MPARSIKNGELPEVAAVREIFEETRLRTRVVRTLGVEQYGMWPAKPQFHERHFFQVEMLDGDVPERWQAGEDDLSDDGDRVRWSCWWTPREDSPVLCAGLGARLGGIAFDD